MSIFCRQTFAGGIHFDDTPLKAADIAETNIVYQSMADHGEGFTIDMGSKNISNLLNGITGNHGFTHVGCLKSVDKGNYAQEHYRLPIDAKFTFGIHRSASLSIRKFKQDLMSQLVT